jgi:hypothetical protein
VLQNVDTRELAQLRRLDKSQLNKIAELLDKLKKRGMEEVALTRVLKSKISSIKSLKLEDKTFNSSFVDGKLEICLPANFYSICEIPAFAELVELEGSGVVKLKSVDDVNWRLTCKSPQALEDANLFVSGFFNWLENPYRLSLTADRSPNKPWFFRGARFAQRKFLYALCEKLKLPSSLIVKEGIYPSVGNKTSDVDNIIINTIFADLKLQDKAHKLFYNLVKMRLDSLTPLPKDAKESQKEFELRCQPEYFYEGIFNNFFSRNVFGTKEDYFGKANIVVKKTFKGRRGQLLSKESRRAPYDVTRLACLREWEITCLNTFLQKFERIRQSAKQRISDFFTVKDSPTLKIDLLGAYEDMYRANHYQEFLYNIVKKNTKGRMSEILKRDNSGNIDWRSTRAQVLKLENFSDWKKKEKNPKFSLIQCIDFVNPSFWEFVRGKGYTDSIWIYLNTNLNESKNAQTNDILIKITLEWMSANI